MYLAEIDVRLSNLEEDNFAFFRKFIYASCVSDETRECEELHFQ